jgi:tRNA threonylcarbamoyladenosine biosynthesis protein TsaB
LGRGGEIIDVLPNAVAMLRLAPDLLAAGMAVPADQALPRYIRDKVAKTTQERAAEKSAALAL